MRAMGLAFLITLVAFAGCMGGGDDDDSTPTDTATGSAAPTDTPSPSGSGTQTDTGTSDPDPEGNSAPLAALSANLTGGFAPLSINFTLDASDDDGDTLVWSFDADGDGVADAEGIDGLPAHVVFVFEEAGNFTAALWVEDAQSNSTASWAIQVNEPVTEATDAVTFSGTITSPDPFAVASAQEGAPICLMPLVTGSVVPVPEAQAFGHTYNVPAETHGGAFSFDAPAAVATFLVGDSPSTSGNAGDVPNGATQVMVCATEPMVEYVFTLTVA